MINKLMGVAAIEQRMQQLESQLEWAEGEVVRLRVEQSQARALLWQATRLEARHDTK